MPLQGSALTIADYVISDTTGGGDCSLIGSWSSGSKTCTLNSDISSSGVALEIASDGITLDGNYHTVTGNAGTGIGVYMYGRTNVTITNLNLSGFGDAFYLENSSGNQIMNSNASASGLNGLRLVNSNSNNLADSTFNNSGTGNGIRLEGSSNNQLSGLTVAGTNGHGVHMLSASDNNLLNGNQLSNNGSDCVRIESASHNQLTSNMVLSCSNGVYMEAAFSNTLHDNIFSNNFIGVDMSASNSNLVYNNDFQFNTIQAQASGGGGNAFFQAPPVGGNYWEDYAGCQNLDGDNFCDNPYTAAGIIDSYPWTTIDGWVDHTPPAITNTHPAGTIYSGATIIGTDYSDSVSGIDTSSVTVSLDGNPLTGCTVTASSVSCPVSGLAYGAHSFVGSVSDNAGNTSQFGSSFPVGDNQPPQVTYNGSTGVLGNGTPTLTATFADAEPSSGVDTGSAELSLNGGAHSACSVNGNNITCSASGLADGTYTATIYITDTDGNTGSGSGSFTVDTTPPTVSNLSPSGTIYSDSATISAAFSDSGAGVDTGSLTIKLDGNVLTGCSVSASGASCPVSGLSYGSHAISGSIADTVGNEATIGGGFQVGDNVAPTLTYQGPTGYLKTHFPVITAKYSDPAPSGGVKYWLAKVYLNGNGPYPCGADGTGSGISCTLSQVGDGNYSAHLTIEDYDGNVGTADGSFTIDTVPPTASDDAPGGWQHTDVTVHLSCHDATSGCDVVKYRLDGGSWQNGDTVTVSGDGTHNLQYYPVDKAGNNGAWTTVYVKIDATGPVATVTAPASPVDGDSTTITIDYSDAASGIDAAATSITLDGSPVAGCSITGSGASCPVSGLAPGEHQVGGTVSDKAGNQVAISGTFHVMRHYFFTWYDNRYSSNWVLMGNPGGSGGSTTFSLAIAGNDQDLSQYSFGNDTGCATTPCAPGEVPPGKTMTPAYDGLIGGPVKVTSQNGEKALVSQRTLWPKGGHSLEEVTGMEESRLADHYYWPWYDQLSDGYANWILAANPSETETVRAEVYIAGEKQQNRLDPARSDYGQYYFEIAPGDNVTPTFPGKQGGPVEVKAYVAGGDWNNAADRRDVIASQRVLSGHGSAFNEAVGVPAGELSDHYLWTWYDDKYGRNWMLIANTESEQVTYRVEVAGGCNADGTPSSDPGTACYQGTLAPQGSDGDIHTFRFSEEGVSGLANGPVELTAWKSADHSPAKVIASQRIVFGPSFGETMGYPASALTGHYLWTWYDQQTAGMRNWVLVANPPAASGDLYYEIWVAGQKLCDESDCPAATPGSWSGGPLAPGANVTPTFDQVIGGPVEVRTFADSAHTTPADAIASQRVLYYGYFNEVVGSGL